jgi:RNA polymerase sigma factor (sigma-70 family)
VEDADRAILDAVAKGQMDRAARLILRHHGPALLAHARRLVREAAADDVLQEAVMALLRALENGHFQGKSSLRTYAMRIVQYQAFRVRRSRWSRLLRLSDDPAIEDVLAAPPPDEPKPWAGADEEALAEQLLALLEERQRTVLAMRLDGLSFADIACTLRTSAANAQQIHSRAVRALRARVAEDEQWAAILERAGGREEPGGRRDR